jgi:hypothetical protein
LTKCSHICSLSRGRLQTPETSYHLYLCHERHRPRLFREWLYNIRKQHSRRCRCVSVSSSLVHIMQSDIRLLMLEVDPGRWPSRGIALGVITYEALHFLVKTPHSHHLKKNQVCYDNPRLFPSTRCSSSGRTQFHQDCHFNLCRRYGQRETLPTRVLFTRKILNLFCLFFRDGLSSAVLPRSRTLTKTFVMHLQGAVTLLTTIRKPSSSIHSFSSSYLYGRLRAFQGSHIQNPKFLRRMV